ncbi:hypothetical protein BpHYR1_035964 [Brachionus plicatilis]|uniref:Retrotransposon gag domain-containing protein n=1 Tax=Brachionus plicatilis TaxID=10195 RepID=A0A3M7RFX3_BRAPC|nr:hypothetical protein BpHYR1_035964 [Brachionus plicatilis]
MQKRDESVTWEKFKNQLLATLKPADVQRGLRSELKSIKLTLNFEDNIMKFQTIANKIDTIDEFALVWFFLEALDPRVRAELESKNVETPNDAIRHAKVFTKGLGNFSKPTVVNYSRKKNFNNEDSFMKPSINGKEYVSKFRGQKFDHNGKEKFRSQNELKKNLICFGCKKPGHKISQCRLNNNNNNYKQYTNTRRVNMVEEVNNDSDNDNFFGARSSKRSIDIQKLSKLECEIMARSKTCNGFLMFCKDGNCEFDENPIENFKWLSTVLTTGYYCRLQKTKIRYKKKYSMKSAMQTT